MRIVSLLPSATEIVYALGLGDWLVARSHECVYPPDALSKPIITRSLIPPDLPSREIDRMVSETLLTHATLYTIDKELLRSLKPDLILTQALCLEWLAENLAKVPSEPDICLHESAARAL